MTDLVLIHILVQEKYLVFICRAIYVASVTNLLSLAFFLSLFSKERLDTRLKVLFWFEFVIWDFFLSSGNHIAYHGQILTCRCSKY